MVKLKNQPIEMSEQEKKDTEQKIFEAALAEFTEKGFAAARMQEIATRAGINKALLHYYFRSKDRLFEAVFEHLIGQLAPLFGNLLDGPGTLLEKFELFYAHHIDFMRQHPFIPGFVIHELNQNPERLVALFNIAHFPIQQLQHSLQQAQEEGLIKTMNPLQIFVNMLALSVFPFIAKPLLQEIGRMDESTFDAFLAERKRVLPQMLWDMIKA